MHASRRVLVLRVACACTLLVGCGGDGFCGRTAQWNSVAAAVLCCRGHARCVGQTEFVCWLSLACSSNGTLATLVDSSVCALRRTSFTEPLMQSHSFYLEDMAAAKRALEQANALYP